MAFSLLLFAYAIGTIAVIEEASSERQIILQSKMQYMRHVLRSHRLPSALVQRVSAYLSYNEYTSGGMTMSVLEELPEGLAADVMAHMVGGLLPQVPFLSLCENDEGFLATVATRVVPVIFMTDEALVSQGTRCACLHASACQAWS